MKYVIAIPIECGSEHGARVFLSRVRYALATENVISGENTAKIFIAESNWHLDTQLELAGLGDHS